MKFISTASFGNSNRKQDLIYQNSFFKKTWFHTLLTYVIQSSFQQLHSFEVSQRNPVFVKNFWKRTKALFSVKKRSKKYEICVLVFSSLWPWYGFSIPMVSYHRFGMFLETHTAPTSLINVFRSLWRHLYLILLVQFTTQY